MTYDAILWDCDGVLIDSEIIACDVARNIFEELGYNISLEDYILKFVGKSLAQAITELEDESGLKLTQNFPHDDYVARQEKDFNDSLKATKGIDTVLSNIDLPMAVASGSAHQRLLHTLGITNLLPYFNGHIYSAEMVENGKPAPDVFLHAAEKLNANPKNCLVIEDGVHGIYAAQAAGMDVVAFTGGSHITEPFKQNLIETNVSTFIHDITDILPIIKNGIKKAA